MFRKILVSGLVFIFVFSMSVSFFQISKADSVTIYVDDSGGADYTSIQDAIDNSSAGDTVYVYSGSYDEQITIDKSIILQGQSKSTTTVSYSSLGGYTLRILDGVDNVKISGFNIKSTISRSYLIDVLSNNNKLYNNKLEGCQASIHLDGSNNNNIYENDIICGSYFAIYLLGSSYNNIYSNTITNNDYRGITFDDGSDYNEIYLNDFSENGESSYCIWFDSSPDPPSNNVIYHNNFYDGIGGFEPYSNFWYNTTLSEGNYWWGYTGSDSTGDGIGETPYDVAGSGNRQDLYPFINPNGWLNEQPVADAGGPYSGFLGENVLFDGSGSTDDGSIVNYTWDFGDGSGGTGLTVMHSYSSTGDYTAVLTVTDNDGLRDNDSASVTIDVVTNSELVISAPSAVVEESSFIVNITADSLPVENVIVNFSSFTEYTNSQGYVIFTAPSVSKTTNFTITAYKNGYISDEAIIMVYDNSIHVDDQLVINTDSSVDEGSSFSVSVTANDLPVNGVTVMFNGVSYQTGSDGTVAITAPSVNYDFPYSITVSKTGYKSDTSLITVKNKEVSVSKGYVSGTVYDSTDEVVENALVCVILSNQNNVITSKCSYTDENGEYKITVSAGTYNVQASKYGYVTGVVADVAVVEDQGNLIDFALDKVVEEESESIVDYTINEEIQKGSILGVVDVASETEQVKLYHDVDVELSSNDIGSDEGVKVVLSGDGTPGSKIVIYLGQVENPDDIVVSYDGGVIQKSKEVEAFFKQGNEKTEYIIFTTEENSVGVIINNPSFSTHEISVKLVAEVVNIIQSVLIYIGFFVVIAILFVGIGITRNRL